MSPACSPSTPTRTATPWPRPSPAESEQRLQGLLTTMVWDEQDLKGESGCSGCGPSQTEGDGVLILDDTGFREAGAPLGGSSSAILGHLGKGG